MSTKTTRAVLSRATLSSLPDAVERPNYALDDVDIGIVHFGPGAFHRAHQAVYLDALLATDPRWSICGVSLHSAGVRDALATQDGLYTLALLDEQPSLRVIGSLREILCAPQQQAQVLTRLAQPQIKLVTLTITEKGYCLAGDGLDMAHPDIVHDVASPQTPRSAIGYLVAGLRERHRQGTAPFTVLSCDNLADNGGRLRGAVLAFAERIDSALAQWIEREVAFPRSMVDSITPATDDALRERVCSQLGVADAWPIQREAYTQWVVEDRFCNARPALESVGVTLSDDIAGYDRAKLRLLNGPHSTLAYVGSLMGIGTVAEAMRDEALAGFVERLMRQDMAPTLKAPQGFDAQAYTSAILARFRNPAIAHKLSQIAWDGSQKLPVRLMGTIADALDAGADIARLCLPVAAWMHFVRRQAQAGERLVDPLEARLGELGRAASGQAEADVPAFLALDSVFAPWSGDARIRQSITEAYAALGDGSPQATREAIRIV
ncbi:mannitol dehydrogenase family protein [Oleiagrimonas sp. C23AA]|uniref:mannitol dehydrogenase family protein n=1 Tax=Oleiagrimonas sp. C23AA TaxID=2719047 RepID=UPI00197EAC84|nr:mannitol dehydrogenase family protein [Oleiagrimonas sp. C23AA]